MSNSPYYFNLDCLGEVSKNRKKKFLRTYDIVNEYGHRNCGIARNLFWSALLRPDGPEFEGKSQEQGRQCTPFLPCKVSGECCKQMHFEHIKSIKRWFSYSKKYIATGKDIILSDDSVRFGGGNPYT